MSINRDKVDEILADIDILPEAKAKVRMQCAESIGEFMEGLVFLAEFTLENKGQALSLRDVQLNHAYALKKINMGVPLALYIEAKGQKVGLSIEVVERKKYIVVKDWRDKVRHRYMTILGWTTERAKEEPVDYRNSRSFAQKEASREYFDLNPVCYLG